MIKQISLLLSLSIVMVKDNARVIKLKMINQISIAVIADDDDSDESHNVEDVDGMEDDYNTGKFIC